MNCQKCGTIIESDDDFCPQCGTKIRKKENLKERIRYKPEKKITSGLAIASLIISLCGLIFFMIPFLSILALILGIIAILKIHNNKFLKGKILAIIGILLNIIKWVVLFLIIHNSPKLIKILSSLFYMILHIKI